MKKIIKGIQQTIILSQTGLPEGKNIKLSLVGKTGAYLKDTTQAEAKDLTLTYNTSSHLYETQTTISAEEPDGYIRLYFYSIDAAISNEFYPEDAELKSNVTTLHVNAEIVPVQYFVDYILAAKSKVDPIYEKAVTEYITDRDSIRRALLAAQNDLELKSGLYFTERIVEERRDNYFERFNNHFWQIAVSYPPINELIDVKIWYGNVEVANIDKSLFTFDRMQGIIEFLPSPTGQTAGLYTMLLNGISGMSVSIFAPSILDRIPNMFNPKYKSGLLTANTDRVEEEGLRHSVCRRAFVNICGYLDPSIRQGSDSESIDGVSASVSYNQDKYLERLMKEEDKFIMDLQRKYGQGICGVVV